MKRVIPYSLFEAKRKNPAPRTSFARDTHKYTLTDAQIAEINRKCEKFQASQGIAREPFGFKLGSNGYVIYCSYPIGGKSGGDYGDGKATPYTEREPKDRMAVIDLVLHYLKPDISFLTHRQVMAMVQDQERSEGSDYYGNYTDYRYEYIMLADLEAFLGV